MINGWCQRYTAYDNTPTLTNGLIESTRAIVKYMIPEKKIQKPCIMHQDDEYGKNVFDGFTQQLKAMNLKATSVTTYKRGVSDFSAQAAKMKSDGPFNARKPDRVRVGKAHALVRQSIDKRRGRWLSRLRDTGTPPPPRLDNQNEDMGELFGGPVF